MAQLVMDDRVYENASVNGTGVYTLSGTALTGFQTFAASRIADGNVVRYFAIKDSDWEVGIGTYTAAGGTLSRTTIESSSNANAAVNWNGGAGAVTVTIGVGVGKAQIEMLGVNPSASLIRPNPTGDGALAFGNAAEAGGDDAVAFGGGVADGTNSFALPAGTAYAPSSFVGPDATSTAGAGGGWSIVWGLGAVATANAYGAIVIGDACEAGKAAAQSYYCHAYGYQAASYLDGMRAYSYGQRAAKGDSQRFELHLGILTTTATPANLVVGQDSLTTNDFPTLKDNRIYSFWGTLNVWQYGGASGSVGDSKAWQIAGAIKVVGGVCSLAGAVVVDDLSVGSALAVSFLVSADDANNRLQIQVTGEANKNLNWNCHLDFNETG